MRFMSRSMLERRARSRDDYGGSAMSVSERQDRTDDQRMRHVGCTAGAHHDRECPRDRPALPAGDPRRDPSQPDRDVAHVPVLRRRRAGRRLAPRPPGQPGRRRGRPGHRRGHGRRPGGPDHARATWASGTTARRAAGPDRPVRPIAGAVAGIQLAHAGRKASCDPPWKAGLG